MKWDIYPMKNTIWVRCYGKIWDNCLTWTAILSGLIWLRDGIQYGGRMGNTPNSMEVFSWDNHRIKWILYLAMFDYRSVPNNKWEIVVDIADLWPSSSSSLKKGAFGALRWMRNKLDKLGFVGAINQVITMGACKITQFKIANCYGHPGHPSHDGNSSNGNHPSLDWQLHLAMGVDGMSSTKMGTFPNFPTISWAFYADFMGYSCGYDGVSLYTMVKSWVVSREWNGRGTILLFPQVVEDYMSVNTTRYLS